MLAIDKGEGTGILLEEKHRKDPEVTLTLLVSTKEVEADSWEHSISEFIYFYGNPTLNICFHPLLCNLDAQMHLFRRAETDEVIWQMLHVPFSEGYFQHDPNKHHRSQWKKHYSELRADSYSYLFIQGAIDHLSPSSGIFH